MKPNSITASSHGRQVEEVERVVGTQLGRLLRKAVLVHQLPDPFSRVHREVVTTMRTDVELLLELVVAVVRIALRARVRMRPPAVLGRGVLVLN